MKTPRCNTCRRPVKWLRWATSRAYRTFEPRPVDGVHHQGRTAYPTDGPWAWGKDALVEEFMARREIPRAIAEAEVYDVPWYVPHQCDTHDTHHDDETRSDRQ